MVVKNITSSSTPILMGFNSNEGFLTLMQFLTKEFPTEKLHTEGFSRKMAMKMIAKMFPSMPAESHKVIDFLYSEWSLRGEQKASRRFLSLEKMVGDALYTCSQEEIGGLPGPVFRCKLLLSLCLEQISSQCKMNIGQKREAHPPKIVRKSLMENVQFNPKL